MSRVEYTFAQAPLAEVCTQYRDADRFIVFCRECARWNKCWCCPPLTVNAEDYLRPYSYVVFVAARIFFDQADQARCNSFETVRTVAWEALKKEKAKLFDALLLCEAWQPGSVQLGSGGCHLCEMCARAAGKPCRHPDKLRYSLDSFGFDLTAISEEMLGIKLQWSDGKQLPEYYTLIHALLCKQPMLDVARHVFEAWEMQV